MLTAQLKTAEYQSRLRAKNVLHIEAAAIAAMSERLDSSFDNTIELISSISGHVVTIGIGKSGIIARKIASTLASTGTPAFFLHAAEALHGDFGKITKGDILLAFSYSGETEEILKLIPSIERAQIPLISIVGNCKSTLAQASDIVLNASINKEACPLGLAPTASTTAAMALGDAIAMAVLEYKGFKTEDFATLHPGGQLGRNLLRVEDIMHTGSQIPRVSKDNSLLEAIFEISQKGFGITTVTSSEDLLLGVISDGDLRRLIEKHELNVFNLSVSEALSINHPRNPKPCTVSRSELATQALSLMETHRITSLIVIDEKNKIEGVVHIHDLWQVYYPNKLMIT